VLPSVAKADVDRRLPGGAEHGVRSPLALIRARDVLVGLRAAGDDGLAVRLPRRAVGEVAKWTVGVPSLSKLLCVDAGDHSSGSPAKRARIAMKSTASTAIAAISGTSA
jgi:hypothetical protein